MNISQMENEALLSAIKRMGKTMTDSSSSSAIAIEKQRIIYVKEAMKRGLIGYRLKKKYVDVW